MKITLATKITICRILAVIPTAALYIAAHLADQKYYAPLVISATTVFALLCISDFIDGAVARKTHTVTDLGKFLDPVADKLVIAVMLFLIVCFGYNNGIDLDGAYPANRVVIALLGGLIMARELVIGTLRSLAAKKGKVLASDMLGKVKTACMNTGTIILLLSRLNVVFGYMGTVLFYISAALTVASGVHYIVANRDVFNEENDDAE